MWMIFTVFSAVILVQLIGVLLPFGVARVFGPERMAPIVSLGQCLSAGLIFSLGIMHIVPEVVESRFEVFVHGCGMLEVRIVF